VGLIGRASWLCRVVVTVGNEVGGV
jgi:hypothetical protein